MSYIIFGCQVSAGADEELDEAEDKDEPVEEGFRQSQ